MKTFMDKTSKWQRQNQRRPVERYTRLLRVLDGMAFTIPAEDEPRFERARAKVRYKVKTLCDSVKSAPFTGPYSGLTRRELAMTRTSEPDWF